MSKNSNVFLDIIIGDRAAGRIVIELFNDTTPFTAENFRGLCTGDYGKTPSGISLSYLDTLFHKVIKNRYCIGGDIVHNTGQGGHSIYGPVFMHENFDRRHSHAGLLSMVSKGHNTNSSCFMFTFAECSDLDNSQTVCGQVVEGMKVLRMIEEVLTDTQDRPIHPVRIFKCGELGDDRDHLKYEEFADQIKIYKGIIEKRAQKREQHLKAYYEAMNKKNLNLEVVQPISTEIAEEEPQVREVKIPYEDLQERMKVIQSRIQACKKANLELAEEEALRNTDPSYKKSLKSENWKAKQGKTDEKLDVMGLGTEKKYLLDNAMRSANIEKEKFKREKRNRTSAFDTDALLRGYKRRLKKLEFDQAEYERQRDHEWELNEDKLNKMAEELKDEQKRRNKFSRRRPFFEDMDISYINERNRVYNNKLQRHFKDHAAEIKANIDRGSAL